jgi:hypothetical protein
VACMPHSTAGGALPCSIVTCDSPRLVPALSSAPDSTPSSGGPHPNHAATNGFQLPPRALAACVAPHPQHPSRPRPDSRPPRVTCRIPVPPPSRPAERALVVDSLAATSAAAALPGVSCGAALSPDVPTPPRVHSPVRPRARGLIITRTALLMPPAMNAAPPQPVSSAPEREVAVAQPTRMHEPGRQGRAEQRAQVVDGQPRDGLVGTAHHPPPSPPPPSPPRRRTASPS